MNKEISHSILKILGSCKKMSIALYLITCAWLYFYRHLWRKPEKYLKQVPLFIKSKRIKYQSSRLIDWLSLILCCLLCYCFIYLVTHFFFQIQALHRQAIPRSEILMFLWRLEISQTRRYKNTIMTVCKLWLGLGMGLWMQYRY